MADALPVVSTRISVALEFEDGALMSAHPDVPPELVLKLGKAWMRTEKAVDFGGNEFDVYADAVLEAGTLGLKQAGLNLKEAKLMLAAAQVLTDGHTKSYK